MNGRGILLLRMRKLINGSNSIAKIDNYTENYSPNLFSLPCKKELAMAFKSSWSSSSLYVLHVIK